MLAHLMSARSMIHTSCMLSCDSASMFVDLNIRQQDNLIALKYYERIFKILGCLFIKAHHEGYGID